MDKIEIMKKMAESDPTNGAIWYLLGVEYGEQELEAEALGAYSKALVFADSELRVKVMLELSKLSTNDGNVNGEDDDSEQEELVNTPSDNVVKLKVIHGDKGNGHLLEDSEKVFVTFEDVGGLDSLKETIQMKIIKPFTNPELFSKFKKKTGGGILLYGPPGCGKTFIAKATAGECHARFRPIHITDVLDPYLGVSAQNIKDIFAVARAKKPCVLFFDEIDTIGFNRSKLSSEHMRPIIDQLLSEIEGIDSSTDELLIIGATNTPWDVDPAFKRPGRFDKMIFVEPPDLKAREVILRLKIEGRPVANDIDYLKLARSTELYSGADLENIVEVATEKVIQEIMKTDIERSIKMNDLLLAIEENKPTTLEWLNVIKNYIKYANQSGLYDDVEKYLNKQKKLL